MSSVTFDVPVSIVLRDEPLRRLVLPAAPYEYIAKIWTSEPDRFIVNPIHQMSGLNT